MIGDRIKALRTFKNMTQDKLVDGIASIAYLSKVENGQAKPSELFLMQIAEKLSIDAEVLLKPSLSSVTEVQVEKILHDYWKRKILHDRDISLFKLLSTELPNNKILLMVFSVLIRFYYSDSRLAEAKEAYYFSKRIVKHEEVTDDEKEAAFYYLYACGVLHIELYEFQKANEYFLRTETYLPNDNREKARVYYNLSLVNERINTDKTLCLYYSEKAYEFIKKTGDANRTVKFLLFRSIQFFSINQPDKAMDCVLEAQKLVPLNDSDLRLKSSIIYSFGRIHQLKGEIAESIQHFKEFISLVEPHFPEKASRGYKRLAEISIQQKEWESSANYLEQAQNIAKEFKKVFFDKEIKLLEIFTYKIKQQNDKYEKEMQKLLSYCTEQHDYDLGKYLASELGVYFYEQQAYKKAASVFKQSYEFEKKLNQEKVQIVEGYRFEF
ncbi:helix-turn-helix domain-containing protein [Bacillus sp. M6-12]|uniref:helix-turn-helix domain-containing protein n=1 Tax=Bacillus sp. M6-12 TaxID=2054166 RepID=UPI0015E0E4B2|nr:helix-turn-helix transcriptional regulator [Bacillus sp. M6-12]